MRSIAKRYGFSAQMVLFALAAIFLLSVRPAFAGEADIVLPDLSQVAFTILGSKVAGVSIMYLGLVVCIIGLFFAVIQYNQTKNKPAHKSMLEVSQTIWETCKSYLAQQGKFLIILWVLIAICMVYYFMGLSHMSIGQVVVILVCSIFGILGSYSVAWFGMRINTRANSRTAFASLQGSQ
jgi:K(+)-stimulated pyrophosphate-energized sodium pump